MNIPSEVKIDSFQAEAIARGLFAIARADGMHEREAALIAGFYGEAGGSSQSLSELERREDITPEELAAHLKDQEMGRLFLRTAILLTLADGKVSAQESALVHKYAERLGLSADLAAMQGEVKELLLSQL